MKRISCLLIILFFIPNICLAEPKILKVKGFYLGMNLGQIKKNAERVYKTISPKIKLDYKPGRKRTKKTGNDMLITILNYDDQEIKKILKRPGVNNIYFNLDDNGKLIHLTITYQLVENLFNVHDMDAEVFAKEFAKNYKISPMTPIKTEDRHGIIETKWRYISDKYDYFIIIEDLAITIKKVTKKGETKFDDENKQPSL